MRGQNTSLLLCVLFYIIFLSRHYYRQFEPPSSLDVTLGYDILAMMAHLITADLKLAVIIRYHHWFGV
jgi:hypothetical protein